MSIKDKFKNPGSWKVLAGVGTAAVLGLGGIALAGPGNSTGVPEPINLQSQSTAAEAATTSTAWRYALPADSTLSSPASPASSQASVDTGTTSQASPDPALDSPYSPPPTKAAPPVTSTAPKNVSVDSPDVPRTTRPTKAAPAKTYVAPRNVSADSPDVPRTTKVAPATATKDYSPEYSYDSADSSLES